MLRHNTITDLEWPLTGSVGSLLDRQLLAASRLCTNHRRSSERLSRKSPLTAKAPGNVITEYGRTQLLTNALLEYRTPRHQAEAEAIIEHRKAPTRCDHHPPIDARGAFAVEQRSINHTRLFGDGWM
jgi:hypothetical protein